MLSIVMLTLIMLSAVRLSDVYAACHNEAPYSESSLLSVVMLSE